MIDKKILKRILDLQQYTVEAIQDDPSECEMSVDSLHDFLKYVLDWVTYEGYNQDDRQDIPSIVLSVDGTLVAEWRFDDKLKMVKRFKGNGTIDVAHFNFHVSPVDIQQTIEQI